MTPECITTFNELKLGKSLKWIIYKISDNWKEIVVEETSKTGDYEAFREKLLSAKSVGKDNKESIGPRWVDQAENMPVGVNTGTDMPYTILNTTQLAVKGREARSHSLRGVQTMPL